MIVLKNGSKSVMNLPAFESLLITSIFGRRNLKEEIYVVCSFVRINLFLNVIFVEIIIVKSIKSYIFM